MDTPRRSSSPLMLMMLLLFSLGVGYFVGQQTPAPTAAPTAREEYEATKELLAIAKNRHLYTRAYFRVLIGEGANVNGRGNMGETPLMCAVNSPWDLEWITQLIEAGADVNAKEDKGATPLMSAGGWRPQGTPTTPPGDLHAADRGGCGCQRQEQRGQNLADGSKYSVESPSRKR